MRKSFFLFLFLLICAGASFAQAVLPAITAKDINGHIVISWKNKYTTPVKYMSIQRSYDSLRNYSTIDSILSPQNIENGYSDESAPYNRMYYRLFIFFDGGNYYLSNSARPVKEVLSSPFVTDPKNPDPLVTSVPQDPLIRNAFDSSSIKHPVIIKPGIEMPATPVINEPITYPSRRIYTGKDNNVIIFLPGAKNKKYSIKFFDETDHALFDINKITDDYLIIEKVNFLHAGWFFFEIADNGKTIEKNRFYIPKDGR